MGSLLAAVASFLAARRHGQEWLLRMDDLDTPRAEPGAENRIVDALEQHGMVPDRPMMRQSERRPVYQAALDRLSGLGRCYYCTCSRKSLPRGAPYPGTCRHRSAPVDDAAIRLRLPDTDICFTDAIQGSQKIDLRRYGDPIVRRRDGIFAYALACAVDDGEPDITEVIRGADLLRETAPQLAIMDLLGLPRPAYAHVPVLMSAAGQKLSKQSHAAPIDGSTATSNLRLVFSALGIQGQPPGKATPAGLLEWATSRFDVGAVPARLPAGFPG